MSTISKLPFEFIKLSKDLQVPSVPYSGWPPPSTLLSSQLDSNDISLTIDRQSSNSTPLVIDEIQHERKLSTWNNGKTYFEKLRSVAQNRYNNEIKSTSNQSDDTLENLIGLIQPCHTWNSDNMKNNKTQGEILLSQFTILRQIYINNERNKSIQIEQVEEKVQQRFDTYTFSIITPYGNVLFDFSKQSINYDIYIQLMQLVPLSNLDKLIQKIFHKSGEYHHVDYKGNRRNHLEKDQENHQYQLSNSNNILKSHEIDKTNSYITMAKAVHFRASSHCFVLDGIDISSRFQYDRHIIRNTCLRFHSDINTDLKTVLNENNDSPYSASLSDCTVHSAVLQSDGNTNRTIQFILVLCTQRMRTVYQLLESLLQSYILPNISIVYMTFDQIEPFLTKYEQMSNETLPKETPTSFEFQNKSSTTMPIENNTLNQSTILLQSVELKKEFPTDTKVKVENITKSAPEVNLPNKIDLSNEELLLDYLRTSSLVLICMKHLDETYLTTFIRWYSEALLKSDLSSTSSWNKIMEHCWLITSDYQRAETVFSIPKTSLFLWPTEHHDFDHMSIIISSILILPIALSINYKIYSRFIDGLSIVDKHCQETTIDRNVCVQMALLRIWSNICERKTTAIITCDDDLQFFGEYAPTLLEEYSRNNHTMTSTYKSIHGMSLAKMFLQQILNEQNNSSYDLIAIRRGSQKTTIDDGQSFSFIAHSSQDDTLSDGELFLNPHVAELLTISAELCETEKTFKANKSSYPYTLILLDQLTPLTLGVLVGVYQMSIFFENVIHNDPNLTPDLNQLNSDE